MGTPGEWTRGVHVYRLATDDTYTVDEVSEMLDSLEMAVRAEIESELLFSAHTSVLLINQILRQVESQRATVSVDVYQLEDRCASRLLLPTWSSLASTAYSKDICAGMHHMH